MSDLPPEKEKNAGGASYSVSSPPCTRAELVNLVDKDNDADDDDVDDDDADGDGDINDDEDEDEDIFSPALPLPMSTQSVWSAFPDKEMRSASAIFVLFCLFFKTLS